MSKAAEWQADILVDEVLVGTCLQEQFPKLMPLTSLRYISEGWDNRVFLINEKIIFRFPRRRAAVELIEQENKALTQLPDFGGVQIPRLCYLGKPSARYPYPFHGYQLIQGQSAYRAQLSEAQRKASLKVVAGFLKQLHSIKADAALALGVQDQLFHRTNVEQAIARVNAWADKITTRNICRLNPAIFAQEIAIVRSLELPFADKCLVHGDIDARHLIFNQGELVGVIDWGDMGVNNRAVDLAIIWGFYPPALHAEFLQYYGEVDIATWQYARFLSLYCAMIHILYGTDIGDEWLVIEAMRALRTINPALLLSPV